MSFSATVNLGTVGVAITSVKLYGCTGSNGTDCTGCTALTGYENVGVSSFPLLVSGIPNGVRYVQAEALGACSADAVKQCITISGIPGPTATPAPTMTPTPTGTSAGTTPNPTSTQTPTPTPTPSPSGTTPGTTPAPTNTQTPSPTATLPGCGSTISNTYLPSTFIIQTQQLDLSAASNGDTITIAYTANDRPNRFNIYGNGSYVTSSLWAGSDPDMGTTYIGPWTGNPIDSDGTGSISFTYVAGTSYELRVDVGGANPNASPSPNPSDAWSVTISCSGTPDPTPFPTATVDTGGGGGTGGGGTMYDCLNGACTQTVSGTYSSLADCQASGCESGGGGCFISGTMITMSDGTQKLIEELVIGDVLKSYSIDTLPLYSDDNTILNTWSTESITGNIDTATIINVSPLESSEIVVINNSLRTTINHRHLVKVNGMWSFVEAKDVEVGDILLDIEGNEVEVTTWDFVDSETKTIFKLDVENLDVYYANGILTHNSKLNQD